MDLKSGQKLVLDSAKLEIEILGMNPIGQPMQINWSDSRVWRVKINGKATPIKEEVLIALLESSKVEEKVEEVKPIEEKPAEVKPVVENKVEEKIPLLKKRLGRPSKVK